MSCGNSCRHEIVLGDSSASKTSVPGSQFHLREAKTLDAGDRFSCDASAGDPCSGSEPPGATEPPCGADLPAGEVVVEGILLTEDDLGAECQPKACDDPKVIAEARICVPEARPAEPKRQ